MEEEPLMLQEMRIAYRGGMPETAGERNAVIWFNDDPKGFRIHLAALERDWLARKDKLDAKAAEGAPAATWNHQGPCPTCGHEKVADLGTEHCVAVAEQWLRENA